MRLLGAARLQAQYERKQFFLRKTRDFYDFVSNGRTNLRTDEHTHLLRRAFAFQSEGRGWHTSYTYYAVRLSPVKSPRDIIRERKFICDLARAPAHIL